MSMWSGEMPYFVPIKENKMPKLVEYKLVEGTSVDSLNDKVNRLIGEGWEPYEQPFKSEYNYIQTMVRCESDQLNG